MSIKDAIVASFVFVVVSGFVVEFVRMTDQFQASKNWGKFALGIFLALAFFALLVRLVKGLVDYYRKVEGGYTEEEKREIRSRPSKGRKSGKDTR